MSKDFAYSAQIQQWGNIISLALLDPSTHIFTMPGMQGIIGYRIAFNCVVVFGDPVCPENEIAELSKTFDAHFRKENKKIVYICTSEKFTNWLLAHTCTTALEFGNEIVLDLRQNPLEPIGKKSKELRKISKRLAPVNISVHEYKETDIELIRELENVAVRWSANRKGTQIYFCDLQVFANATGKRWFYTKVNNEITGLAILNRLERYNGWGLNMLIAIPGAYKHTSEKLVLGIMEILNKEGSIYFSIGSYQTTELGRITGMGLWAERLARPLYRLTEGIFKTSDRHKYWAKFSPQLYPSFTVFSQGIDIKSLLAIVRACHGL